MGKKEQELQQASVHVKYELDMLAATISFLSKDPGGTDQATWNAYLESFVLHLRNLIDFFYPSKKPKADDILAEHYVTNVALWNAHRPVKTNFLREAETKANKQVAHLTYTRLAADKNWSWAAISGDLEQVVTCFLNSLPPGWKAWFQGPGFQGPTGPTGTPSPAVGVGATGPAGPTGSGGTTTR
ncbi:MAG: hypothetical protein ABSF71_04840 [Terriglobia bacterium]|jgi:hypothetical protein